MKTPLLALCILLGSFLSVTFAYGDDIPTQGRWDDERYRSITALPPTLFIEGNVLGDIINIPLDGIETGAYQVVLTHKLGWLVGEFEIK